MKSMPKQSKIYSIDQVGLGESEGNVIICASGQVNSSGWGLGSLSAWAYVTEPEDGIQDFDFVAEPPDGVVLWAFAPISATLAGRRPDWLKGVRVHSVTNSVEALIGDENATCEVRNVMGDGGNTLPWPW